MDEQRLEYIRAIRESAAAVAPRGGSLERVRKLRFGPLGFDLAVWRQMAELGWIGLRLPESQGGVAMGLMESIALHEELGRGLVPEPLIAGSLAAQALALTTEHDLLQRVLTGTCLVALAWQEKPDALEIAGSFAEERLFVPMAAAADCLLVPLPGDGGVRLSLFDAGEFSLIPHQQQDGTTVATARFSANRGRPVSGDVRERLACALDEAALATAAYLLGLAERAFELTLDYLRERRQFGQPLAAFQALQHRAADLMIQLTLTRASVEGAASEADAQGEPAIRSLATSRAKARASDVALLVTREALQMHGAIGWADECDIGLFVRKALVTANEYGSALVHRNRFDRLIVAAE